eukprot:Colp12_sorted_trinity150504_noHs@23029
MHPSVSCLVVLVQRSFLPTMASKRLVTAKFPAALSPARPAVQLHLFLQNVRALASLKGRHTLADRAADFPDLIKQWHPHKNTVRPDNVAPYSSKKYWFVCDEGHEWEACLNNRARRGSGCPKCNLKSNSLLAKYPLVAAEWHPTKNGDLTPDNMAPGSAKKVWWQCKAGHEWDARVSSRSRAKTCCPKCSLEKRRNAPRFTQSLLAAHPDLAQ